MRAWMYKKQTPFLAALLAIGWWMPSEVARGQELIVSKPGTELIAVSDIPLPQATTGPQQKPTSAAYLEQELAEPDWQIEIRAFEAGPQKPAQTNNVSLNWTSAPQGAELPQCETPVVVTKSVTAPDGSQKPMLITVPVPMEIVQVQWGIDSRSGDLQTSHHTVAAFPADRCPVVLWNSENFDEFADDLNLAAAEIGPAKAVITPAAAEIGIDETEIGACSELADGGNSFGRAEFASIESRDFSRINEQTFAELQKLLPKPEADSEVTYLTELSELLQGGSAWLFANEGLLDLTPEEGSTAAVSYLDDLNALVGSPIVNASDVHYRKTVASQQAPPNNAQNRIPRASRRPKNPYTSIASDPNCNGVGGDGVSSLFESMSSIQLNGLSTAPPSQPRADVVVAAELPRPENSACQYLDAVSPMYYTTPVRYGAHRPYRNTHVFWHRPLYYEDPNLERCGETSGCLTTAVSAFHFATAIAFTPYLTAVDHPASCVQSLPDCPTCHSFDCRAYWPGWSWKGAAAQAAAVTGLYFVVP